MQSIKFKFGGAFIAVAAVNLAAGVTLYLSISAQRTDALVINLAGAQRMLSQKMAKEALVVNADTSGTNPLAATLKSSVERFDKVLAGLIHGDAELGLPRTEEPSIVEHLTQVEAFWQPYRSTLVAIANGERADGLRVSAMLADSTSLLARMDETVKLYEEQARTKVARMLAAQAISVAVLLGVIGLAWFGIVNPLVKCLTIVSSTLSRGSVEVSTAAAEVSRASYSLAQSASQQAGCIQETSSSSAEVGASAHSNRESARAGAGLATHAFDESSLMNESLGRLIGATTEVAASNARIGQAMKVIEEIAFQTNIIALNAAVEAARAGEAGTGFSVVADEVRRLSQRCTSAAAEVASLIEDSIRKSTAAKTKMEAVAVAVGTVSNDVTQMKSLICQIDQGSGEQTTGIEQIVQAMRQLEGITSSTAAASEEGAAAAEQLTAHSAVLSRTATDLVDLIQGSASA